MTRELEQFLGASLSRQYKRSCAIVPHVQAIPEKKRMQAVLRYALRDWMECTGDVYLEQVQLTPEQRAERDRAYNAGLALYQEKELEKAFSDEDSVRARGMGIKID